MFYAHKDQYAKVADTKTILYAKGMNSTCVQNLSISIYTYIVSVKYLVHFQNFGSCINDLIIHKNPSLWSLIVHPKYFHLSCNGRSYVYHWPTTLYIMIWIIIQQRSNRQETIDNVFGGATEIDMHEFMLEGKRR